MKGFLKSKWRGEDNSVGKISYGDEKMSVQLDLFSTSEVDDLKIELAETKKQLSNMRRGVFGRYDEMVLKICALENDMHKIQENLGMKEEKILQLSFK